MTIYCCPTWLDWVATQINQKQNWKGKERKDRKSFKWNTWRIWKGGRSLEKCHNVVLNIPNTKVPIMMGLILRKHFYYWKEGSGFFANLPPYAHFWSPSCCLQARGPSAFRRDHFRLSQEREREEVLLSFQQDPSHYLTLWLLYPNVYLVPLFLTLGSNSLHCFQCWLVQANSTTWSLHLKMYLGKHFAFSTHFGSPLKKNEGNGYLNIVIHFFTVLCFYYEFCRPIYIM